MSVAIVCYHLNPKTYFHDVTNNGSFLNEIATATNGICSSFGVLAVSFFFLSSSFLLYRDLSKENYIQKLKKRIRTLLVPLALWNIFGLIYLCRFDDGIFTILKNILLSNYCGPMWFIVQLLVLFILSPVIRFIYKNKKWSFFILLLSYLIPQLIYFNLEIFVQIFGDQLIFLERSVYYLPIYFTGAYLGLSFNDQVIREQYKNKIVYFVALVFFLISFIDLDNPFFFFLKEIQILFLWLIIPKKLFYFKLKWWHQISFFIYAAHFFMNGVVVRIFNKILVLGDNVSASANLALSFRLFFTICSLSLIVAFAYLMIRKLPTTYKILTGGRAPI